MTKRISVASAKQKGRLLQQMVCARISDLTGLPYGVDEVISSRPMGQAGTDVALIGDARKEFPFSVECKRVEKLSIPKWIKQAKENQMKDTAWLLVCKRSREEPIAIISLDQFFHLLEQIDMVKILKEKDNE